MPEFEKKLMRRFVGKPLSNETSRETEFQSVRGQEWTIWMPDLCSATLQSSEKLFTLDGDDLVFEKSKMVFLLNLLCSIWSLVNAMSGPSDHKDLQRITGGSQFEADFNYDQMPPPSGNDPYGLAPFPPSLSSQYASYGTDETTVYTDYTPHLPSVYNYAPSESTAFPHSAFSYGGTTPAAGETTVHTDYTPHLPSVYNYAPSESTAFPHSAFSYGGTTPAAGGNTMSTGNVSYALPQPHVYAKSSSATNHLPAFPWDSQIIYALNAVPRAPPATNREELFDFVSNLSQQKNNASVNEEEEQQVQKNIEDYSYYAGFLQNNDETASATYNHLSNLMRSSNNERGHREN